MMSDKKVFGRDATILEIIEYLHDKVATSEMIAEFIECHRQDIAPYINEMLNDGLILRYMEMTMTRGRPILILGVTCYLLKNGPMELIPEGLSIYYKNYKDKKSHPTNKIAKLQFSDGFHKSLFDSPLWVKKDYICEICGFSSNNYIRRKAEAKNAD